MIEISEEGRQKIIIVLMLFTIGVMWFYVASPYLYSQSNEFSECQQKYGEFFKAQDTCNNNKQLYTPVCLYTNGSVKCGGTFGNC